MKGNKVRGIAKAAGAALAIILCFACLLTALSAVERGSGEQGRQLLENAIRKTAVACYAAEGAYPADVAYMETHYGLQVDERRYLVFYEVFASNLMPQITVIERER